MLFQVVRGLLALLHGDAEDGLPRCDCRCCRSAGTRLETARDSENGIASRIRRGYQVCRAARVHVHMKHTVRYATGSAPRSRKRTGPASSACCCSARAPAVMPARIPIGTWRCSSRTSKTSGARPPHRRNRNRHPVGHRRRHQCDPVQGRDLAGPHQPDGGIAPRGHRSVTVVASPPRRIDSPVPPPH